MDEPISPDLVRLRAALAERGRPARVVARTGSTNDDARAWAAQGAPHGAVIVADTQERGRGRHGRVWSSPPGDSLAISIVVRPRVAPSALPPLALVAGLAARRAIAARVEGAKVKWPNDVVLVTSGGGLRKIAGVLVEGSIAGARVESAIVGVGVNVARAEFPPELVDLATSLARAGATDLARLDRCALALDLLDALDDELAAWTLSPESIGARLSPHDALRGRAVILESGARGVADGIEADGRLRVRVGEGTVHAHAGEVRLVSV
ncbi:MAG: biotin--[acetyl-CoA-carboxylase] ligase [Deltaproteobacteria bacterium]|nr:biotin--[acetyl-CoA-carboxylase] ligase [Deltaproteobacteria bacterium]